LLQSGLSPQPLIEVSSPAAAANTVARLRELRNAAAAALWAAASPDGALDLVAVSADSRDANRADAPVRFGDVEEAAAWCSRQGWAGLAVNGPDGFSLMNGPGFVAVAPSGPSETSPRLAGDLERDLAHAVRLAALESALEQERSMLAVVLENTSDAIVAVDRDLRVVRHNPAAVALLGRADRGSGRLSCGEYLGCEGCHPMDAGGATSGKRSGRGGQDCPFFQILSGINPIVVRDDTTIGPPDARIPVSATYVPAPGGEFGAVAVFRDMRAGHAIDELKSSFVAAVSHELRTPLALISGYSQSLIELDLDEAARRRFIERIDGTANRMRGLIDQLLDVATLESDRLAVDPRRIALGSLLTSIIDEVAEMPGSLAVSLSVPPDLPPVYADPVRIGQVVSNLLDNARKYGTPGSRVTIRARRADDQVVVSVDNDGPEIAPDERETVFERFYRGRDAKSSETPGIGLGLYLSRRLVEAHGGRIELEERPGGTRVSLTLPLVLAAWTRRGGEQAPLSRVDEPGAVANGSTVPAAEKRSLS
jgi:signal transduction histidine kinase